VVVFVGVVFAVVVVVTVSLIVGLFVSAVIVVVSSIELVAFAQPLDGNSERALSDPALKGRRCQSLLRRNPCVEP
jgi:hypothetical protein